MASSYVAIKENRNRYCAPASPSSASSKVKQDGEELILAHVVVNGTDTIVLRDDKGGSVYLPDVMVSRRRDSPEELKDTKVLSTMVGGTMVYRCAAVIVSPEPRGSCGRPLR